MDPDGPVTAGGRRSVAAQTITGVVVTGDRATVEVRRASTAPDISGRLSNLPKPPVKLFLGRGRELAALDEALAGGRAAISQAVLGLGGVGKTELALQYAHLHRDRYRVRWWIGCEDTETITASLAALTAQVNSDLLLTATSTIAADWAVGWLQNQTDWLLVLDNVEELGHVEDLLGRLDGGHILITTRRDLDWSRLVDRCLRLDLLDRESAVKLLLERGEQTDQLTAAVLADELGYLPLALQQAAGYLRQTRAPITTYLDRLRAQPERVLNALAVGDSAERAIAQLWLVTFDRLHRDHRDAIDLLRILACLAPDDAPRHLLPGDPDDEAQVELAMAALASYSLVTVTDDFVSCHRLVQWAVRAQAKLDESLWRQTLDRATRLLYRAMPRKIAWSAVETWPRWALLAPHIEALGDLIPDDLASDDLADLLAALAVYHGAQGRHSAALHLGRRALALTEASRADDRRTIAVRLHNLAYTLEELGRPEEALPLLERAGRIVEAEWPEDSPSVAAWLTNLAATLNKLGRAEEALPLNERALRISETTLPADHPDTAVRMSHLGYTLIELGRFEEALAYKERALRICEATFPENHPYIAILLNNVAQALIRLGRTEEALPLQERALRISEAALPAGHPTLARRLTGLAYTLSALGRADEAEAFRRRAAAMGD